MSLFQLEDLLRLAEIVREETGNVVLEKNFHMLESRIRTHIMKLGIASIADYWAHFDSQEQEERQALRSLMTTHYTFFFREYEHFEILGRWIDSAIPRLQERYQKTEAPLRVWSAACSRGQEAYSLAMFLDIQLTKKYGLPYEIVGTDIDTESIAYALNGVYPIKEANTIPHHYLNGYWRRGKGPVKDFAAIHPNLKVKTHFQALNLLEVDTWPDKRIFDVIFCRNVFIYFAEESVRKVACNLLKRMDRQGLFVSGMSEPLRFSDWTLEPVGPSCYGHRKSIPEAKPVAMVAPAAAPQPAHDLRYRVLCVDDSSTIQTLMRKIFASDPDCAALEAAFNGKEARSKLDAGKYDLITLDIHMPEVNGIEFLERFYARRTDPPVIMVSSVDRTDLELAAKSMSLGAFDYVEKPAMNNLQKSADEILTKARMALRERKIQREDASPSGFDASIGQRIVVHDASQCLRIAVASRGSITQLEHVVRGQEREYRSPPLLIVWNGEGMPEAELLKWSRRQIVTLRERNLILKPNQIFLISDKRAEAFSHTFRFKSVSLQILDGTVPDLPGLKSTPSLQVLVDESLTAEVPQFKQRWTVSDLTPATSFPSLSVEFFAELRKAVA